MRITIDQSLADFLYEEAGVIQMTRIHKKIEKQYHPTQTLKIETETDDDFVCILDNGLYIGDELFKAVPWEYEPTRCFNCHKFGHISEKCPNNSACPVCISHHYGKCKTNQYNAKCRNCGGNHPVWSKNCKKYIEIKCNMNTKLDDVVKHKEESRNARTKSIQHFGQLKTMNGPKTTNPHKINNHSTHGSISYANAARHNPSNTVGHGAPLQISPEIKHNESKVTEQKIPEPAYHFNAANYSHQTPLAYNGSGNDYNKNNSNSDELCDRVMTHMNTMNLNICAIMSVLVDLVAKIVKVDDGTHLKLKTMLAESMKQSCGNQNEKIKSLAAENSSLRDQLNTQKYPVGHNKVINQLPSISQVSNMSSPSGALNDNSISIIRLNETHSLENQLADYPSTISPPNDI